MSQRKEAVGIRVARILDWEGAKSHEMTSSEIFERGTFWDKDIVERKIRSRGLVLHLARIVLKGEALNQKLESENVSIGRRVEKSNGV